VPLEHTLHLHLPRGQSVLEVRGRERTLVERIEVEPGTRRPPPETSLQAGAATPADAELIVPITIVARAGDGFVQRIEVRETAGARAGAWHAPESVQREAAALHAWISVRRPAGDPERRIEARAVDGQGAVDPTPAVLVLPKR